MAPKQWGNGFIRNYNDHATSDVASAATGNLIAELNEPKAAHPVPWSKRWKPSAPVAVDLNINSSSNGGSSSSSSSSASTGSINAFKDSLAQFLLTNKLSAFETHLLASSAQHAGAAGVEDLSKAGAKGIHPKNLARDIMRSLLKDVSLPEVYWAEIPVLDPDTDAENQVWFPFLLPHEVLWKLHTTNGIDKFKAFIDTEMTKEFCTTFNADPLTTFAIGLHGDGAPFQAKMKDSLEQFSWNLPADPKSSRVVFTAIPKKFVGPNTFDAILSIFGAWTFYCKGTCQRNDMMDPHSIRPKTHPVIPNLESTLPESLFLSEQLLCRFVVIGHSTTIVLVFLTGPAKTFVGCAKRRNPGDRNLISEGSFGNSIATNLVNSKQRCAS